MRESALDLLRRGVGCCRLVCELARRSARRGTIRAFLRVLSRTLRDCETSFRCDLYRRTAALEGLDQPAMQHLAREASLLPTVPSRVSPRGVSIVLAVEASDSPHAVATCLASALAQAGELEVLVARPQRLSVALERSLRSAGSRGEAGRLRIETFENPRAPASVRQLVDLAQFPWILTAQADGWFRPDLVYRYGQRLALEGLVEALVTCASWSLDGRGRVFDGDSVDPGAHLHWPLVVSPRDLRSAVLVPTHRARTWNAAGDGDGFLDLVFHVAASDVRKVTVPIPLCARPCARTAACRNEAREMASVDRYHRGLGLSLERADRGELRPPSLGAARPSIQVIVPFRDQPTSTIACLRSVLASRWPDPIVTAVDNGSRDRDLPGAIEALGIRVLSAPGPFNYSRLNNLAAREGDTDLLLFLNNDVVLEPGTLGRLARWAMLSPIGIVAATLFYPDGRLQNAGLDLDPRGPAESLPWHATERGWPAHALQTTRRFRIVDAVSTACAIMRRSVFDRVGGFDELAYPNAFSDTDLSRRVARAGLACVVDPAARAVHAESASRPGDRLEDFEGSRWWAELVAEHTEHGRTP